MFFDSVEVAFEIRQRFAEKRKTGVDYGRITMQNVSTLATRIRIDIMFMISRECSKDEEKMFVRQYILRPVLLVKSKDKPEYALTFADAVQRYGSFIKDSDFTSVYRRIGRAFPDQLEQTFVVIGEGGRMEREQSNTSPWKGAGSGRKTRERSEDGRGRGRGIEKWRRRGREGERGRARKGGKVRERERERST